MALALMEGVAAARAATYGAAGAGRARVALHHVWHCGLTWSAMATFCCALSASRMIGAATPPTATGSFPRALSDCTPCGGDGRGASFT